MREPSDKTKLRMARSTMKRAQEAYRVLLHERDDYRAITVNLVQALKLAELWLMNCLPVVDVPGPKPLPVIRAALATAREQMEKR